MPLEWKENWNFPTNICFSLSEQWFVRPHRFLPSAHVHPGASKVHRNPSSDCLFQLSISEIGFIFFLYIYFSWELVVSPTITVEFMCRGTWIFTAPTEMYVSGIQDVEKNRKRENAKDIGWLGTGLVKHVLLFVAFVIWWRRWACLELGSVFFFSWGGGGGEEAKPDAKTEAQKIACVFRLWWNAPMLSLLR